MPRPPHTSPSFVTKLLQSLPALPLPLPHTSVDDADDGATNACPSNAPNASNPLDAAPEAAKKQLLTLHVLFPNEFLPALDLLDRRLVTRFLIRGNRSLRTAPLTPHDDDILRSASPHIRGAYAENAEAAQHVRNEAQAVADLVVDSAEPVDRLDEEMLDRGAPYAEDAEESRQHLQTHEEPDLYPKREEKEEEEEVRDAAPHHHHQHKNLDTVYYVRSAQNPHRPSRHTTYDKPTPTYQVRLQAWNCTCPAFAFAAFPPSSFPEQKRNIPDVIVAGNVNIFDDDDDGDDDTNPMHNADSRSMNAPHQQQQQQQNDDNEWHFGGAALETSIPPICKHLLACVLGERCGLFCGFVEERGVSCQEGAGWAAGWGD